MRLQRWLAATLSVALISACGGGDPVSTTGGSPETFGPSTSATTVDSVSVEPGPWGERAVAWWDAMGEAAQEGTEHMVSFLDSDLVWEDRVFGYVTYTEDAWVDFQLTTSGGTYPWIDAEILVSADEVLGSFTTPTFEQVDSLERMVIGPDGVRHWVTALGPLEVCRAHSPWMCEFDADGLVDRYVALWSGAPGVDVESIYAPYAVVSDSLLGEKLSGSDAIAESAVSVSRADVRVMTVATISEEWGRAVYLAPRYHDWVEGPEEIRFLVDVDDGSGCPGRMGVALALEGEQVIWEHRYHDIDSVRSCFDPADLEPGWWDEMETPETMVIELTGSVSYADMDIEVFNGAPELDDFVRWGLSRYEAAGLAVPRIHSVTFLRARVYCRDLGGVAMTEGEETSIVLCATPEDVCLDDACETWSERNRRVWLHELAHPWLRQNTNGDVRASFLDLVGSPRWSDADDPWRRRGVERAADALAYGLMDEEVVLAPDVHGDCELRDAAFRILTGTDPIAVCAESTG